MDYPRMLYRDGLIGEDWRIVADADEEADAVANGYLRHDQEAPVVDAPARRSRPAKNAS